MVNPRIITDNVLRSRQEHRDSEEEISYGEIFSDLLADITPGRGCVVTNTFIACGFLLIICLFWRYYGGEVLVKAPLEREDIQLLYRVENGELSETPPYPLDVSRRDLVGEVWDKVTEGASDRGGKVMLILDTELNESLYRAMEENVWIAKVCSIRKLYPPQVRVEVECRQPALIVCVGEGEGPTDDGEVVAIPTPVARDGVVLPREDFSADGSQKPLEHYPWLLDMVNVASLPSECRPGFLWHDERITEALGIVRAFGELWEQMGLCYIRVKDEHVTEFKNGMPFELCVETQNGSEIRWKDSDEAPHEKGLNAEKVRELSRHFDQNGKLDAPGERYTFTFEVQVGEPEP